MASHGVIQHPFNRDTSTHQTLYLFQRFIVWAGSNTTSCTTMTLISVTLLFTEPESASTQMGVSSSSSQASSRRSVAGCSPQLGGPH
jgi:hypothetical protein